MTLRERFIKILETADLSQTEFAGKSGYSRAALTNFINERTTQPKVDFFLAVKKLFPTLNLNWLITGQGDIWDGPPPAELKDLHLPSESITAPQQTLLLRLLTQKLKTIADTLQQKAPDLYRELDLDELTKDL